MSGIELAIGIGAGLAGFGIVWWLFNVVRQQKAPPVDMGQIAPASSARSGGELSVADLGSTWHVILGVPAEATSAEIEAGYQARLAECDRALDGQKAEARRVQVKEAFAFIRVIKH
jgi:hypothetical protein